VEACGHSQVIGKRGDMSLVTDGELRYGNQLLAKHDKAFYTEAKLQLKKITGEAVGRVSILDNPRPIPSRDSKQVRMESRPTKRYYR